MSELKELRIEKKMTQQEVSEKENEILGKVAMWIAIGCFFVPIFALTMVVCGKFLIRKIKENRKSNKNTASTKNAYLEYFGGEANVTKVTKEMTRVSFEVVDLSLVNLEALKSLQIGVLIVGNTVKCSSAEPPSHYPAHRGSWQYRSDAGSNQTG